MSVQGILLLWLNAFVVLKSVRLELIPDLDLDSDKSCVQHLRSTLKTMTYRETLSPILDDTYVLRYAWGHKLASTDGKLEVSTEVSGKSTQWIIEKVPQDRFDTSMPKFTIKNKASGSFLSLSLSHPADGRLTPALVGVEEGSLSANAHWNIDPMTRGVNIQSAAAKLKSVDEGQGEYWMLEAQGPNWNRAKRQWKTASQLPVFPGTSAMRWGDLCQISGCGDDKYYEDQRERQMHFGKLDEDKETANVENFVPQGICGWNVELIKEFVNNPDVVKALHYSSHDDCPSCSLEDVSSSLSKAVHEECFDSCANHLDQVVQGLPCTGHEESAANWTQIFEQVVLDAQCGMLPPDTLMELAEYRMIRKCTTWHAPSLLWVMNDRGVHVKASQHAVCKVLPFSKPFSKSPEDIYQKGACPEGTTCGCPEKLINKQLSLSDRRDRRFSMLFVTPGSAIVPMILNYLKNNVMVKWMVAALVKVATGHAMVPVTMPLYLLKFVMKATWRGEKVWVVAEKSLHKHEDFKCAKMAACWAVPPRRQRSGSCRVSESAKAGGSPVWFLPPPLMKVEKGFQICSLKPCSEGEMSSQKVGFGGKDNQNIYNCQPLIWEDMEETQQTKLTDVLRSTGVHQEYSL